MMNCSFCDSELETGSGMMYVKKDGTVFYYCSSKCKKNSVSLKREGRRQKWTPAARKFIAQQGSMSRKKGSKKKKKKK
jgi:large subunit ribosomal protein L24e